MWWWSQRLEGCIYKHSCSHTCTVPSAPWTLISSFNVEPCFLTLTACRHAGWGLASITDSLLAALVRATAASAPRPQPTALWEALATHPCPHISSGVSNTPRNMEKLRPVDKLRPVRDKRWILPPSSPHWTLLMHRGFSRSIQRHPYDQATSCFLLKLWPS